jgi:hypothetical protein
MALMIDGNGRTDAEYEDALAAAYEATHDDCIVCGLPGCTDPGCDCGNRPAIEVKPEGMTVADVVHVGACCDLYLEGAREIAALAGAVGR